MTQLKIARVEDILNIPDCAKCREKRDLRDFNEARNPYSVVDHDRDDAEECGKCLAENLMKSIRKDLELVGKTMKEIPAFDPPI